MLACSQKVEKLTFSWRRSLRSCQRRRRRSRSQRLLKGKNCSTTWNCWPSLRLRWTGNKIMEKNVSSFSNTFILMPPNGKTQVLFLRKHQTPNQIFFVMHFNTSKNWRRSIVSFSGAFALRLVLRWDLITGLLCNLCSGSQLSIVRGFLSWILWNPSHWILFTSETRRGLVVVLEDDQILPTLGGELRKRVLQMSLIDVWVKSIVSYGCPLYRVSIIYILYKSNLMFNCHRNGYEINIKVCHTWTSSECLYA